MRNLFSYIKSSKKGFTLLELIVVFTVIAILSTVGLASFVNYSKTETLKQAQNDLINTLNTAKSDAFSQIKPVQCVSYTLNGYSVTINTSTWRSYSLNVICSGNTFTLSTKTLPSGVSFNTGSGTPPTTSTNIYFSLLTSGVIGEGDIVLSGNGSTKTVTVTSVGGIE
ncbi:MAG TPA: prepilin-type N-terminal cleavage/methylation domain-containing protein [Candidatus Sulfotelmatobacter sp.]|nr:prepilin-type N-terminal cleavage/methylation domain-containing protein [Candidatus Sulfotelmatobacter sp.]